MRNTLTIFMLLLAAGWLLGGCSSDETAPNDPLPELADEDVASQSAIMAMIVAELAPVALEYGSKADASDGRYQYTFADDEIVGVVELYFATEGAPSSYEGADHARAWTADGAPLSLYPIPDGVAWLLAFDIVSTIDQGAGTAEITGGGTLTIGNYEPSWTVTGFAIEDGGDWPAAGEVTFTNEGITAIVTFDGSDTATVAIGSLNWTLDLEEGELTAV